MSNESGHLSWLREAWRSQALKIDALSRRWADMHLQQGARPALMHKLTRMLDQIAFFKEKERDIVSEIEAMEQKHRFMRQNNMLKTPGTAPSQKRKDLDLDKSSPEPKTGFLEKMLMLWMMRKLMKPNTPEPPTK